MGLPSNQLKVGVILAYASLLLGTVVAIFVTPLMLQSLGTSEFGLYALIGTFVSYLTVLDFGLNNSVVRYVAQYRATSDKARERQFLAMAIAGYLIIALLAGVIGVVLWWKVDVIFNGAFTADELKRARVMFALLACNVVVALPASGLTAIVTAYERFFFKSTVELLRIVVRTVLLVGLLFAGYKAVGIIVLDTVLNVVIVLLYAAYVFARLRVRLAFRRIERRLVREVFSYSLWMVLCLVFGQLFTRLGPVVLGMMDGTTAVALYAVAGLLISYYGTAGYVFSNMLLPQATKLVALNNDPMRLTNFMIRIGRMQFLVASYLLLGFVLFGKRFVTLWAGSAYAGAWVLALLIMVPQTVAMSRDVGVAIQQAQKRNVFRAFYLAVLVAMAIAFALIARRWLDGALAMSVALAATTVIGNGIMNVYYSRVIRIDMWRFYREVFFSRLLALCVAGGAGAIVVRLAPSSGWGALVLQATAYSMAFAAATWRFGMNSDEKRLCREVFAAASRYLGLRVAAS